MITFSQQNIIIENYLDSFHKNIFQNKYIINFLKLIHMKKIIQDKQGTLYWFNGERLEEIGKPEILTALYGNVLFSIGKDIYSCRNGNWFLEKSDVELIPIKDEVSSKQFFIKAGNLMFKENANSAPIQLSLAFTNKWKHLLLPEETKCFAIRDCKTNTYSKYIYVIDTNEYICQRRGYFVDYHYDNAFFDNGYVYKCQTDDEGKPLMVAQAWHLLYKAAKYLLLQAGDKGFALFEDDEYKEIPNIGTIIKTPKADLLSCRNACWHLLDDGMEEIVKLRYEGESYQICDDGSILANKIISYGSGNDPEVGEIMCHYDIRNGYYTEVSDED